MPFSESPLSESPLSESPFREMPLSESPLSESPLSESPFRLSPLSESPLRVTTFRVDSDTETPSQPAMDSERTKSDRTMLEPRIQPPRRNVTEVHRNTVSSDGIPKFHRRMCA